MDLRLFSNNNRVDLAGDGLDYAIRFGDGNWHGTEALRLFSAPLVPVCAPSIASRIHVPRDLMHTTLLRSYRVDEWSTWFQAVELKVPLLTGHVFDSSLALADAAAQGAGVALLPVRLFGRDLLGGRLVTLFDIEVETGSYWLTKLKARRETDGMKAFRGWVEQACREG